MGVRDFRRERTSLESALKREGLDFAATYLAVCDLKELIRTYPGVVCSETIQALQDVLKDPRFSGQTQSYFLYREAADALAFAIALTISKPLAEEAILALKNVLRTTKGHSHRAAARAMGSLPVAVQGPKLSEDVRGEIPRTTWEEILEESGITKSEPPRLFGRSLVVPFDEGNRLLVVKMACTEHAPDYVRREATWVQHLRSERYSFPVRFNVPEAIKIRGSYLFRLDKVPMRIPEESHAHPAGYAIGFIADRDYFTYPNAHEAERRLTLERFREVICRNAWLLGKLTALGIVHSAPIPLFHNRVQRNRRADHGVYEWPRGGRLDRWLDSCSYPNFGMTGLRDFEHLISANGLGRKLYYFIGTQILGLLLVTGSYFRHQDRDRVGLDGQGNPIDARDLFDKLVLKNLVEGVFLNYYHGFAGTELSMDVPLDFDCLSSRMIEEMGVDRHMEEVLRVVDQKQMSDEEFSTFLSERGYRANEIKGFKKGAEDIIIHTGPHLGGFNERISLPELIESVGAMSATCMAGRYWREKFSESVLGQVRRL